MESAYRILLSLHIVFGSLSLITFWIPVMVKKGGNIHIKIGKIYVALMWVVVLSAAGLCLMNLFRGYYIMAGFLGYLAVLTAHPLWYGMVMLKHKRDVPNGVKSINRIFNVILFLGGVGLLLWSLLQRIEGQAILLLIFGCIGISASAPLLFSKKDKETNWLADHIQGLVITGIAGYTAFFAFGGSTFMGHIFTGSLIAIPWILPTIIGVFVIKRYKRKFNLN